MEMHRERAELLSSLSLIFCHSARGMLEANGEEAGRLRLGELSSQNDLASIEASSLNHIRSEGGFKSTPHPAPQGLS